jgi:hypothetical protein
MIIVSVIQDSIVASCQGKTDVTVKYSEAKLKELQAIEIASESVKTREALEQLWTKVVEASKEDFITRVQALHPDLTVNETTGQFYLKLDGILIDHALPAILVEYIQRSVEKGISVDPVVKCWKWFMNNPVLAEKLKNGVGEFFIERFADYLTSEYVNQDLYDSFIEQGLSHEVAVTKATIFEINITKQGFLTGYKASDEIDWYYEKDSDGNVVKKELYPDTETVDRVTGEIIKTPFDKSKLTAEDMVFEPHYQKQSGDAFYCTQSDEVIDENTRKGHILKVGHVISLESWDQVDTEDRRDCVKGLHIGNLSYLEGWKERGSRTQIHTVLVNPMHIGAIPTYCGNNAIRVKEYYVNGSYTVPTNSIYHGSEYGKLSDIQLSTLHAEIKAKAEEVAKKAQEDLAKLSI